MSKFITGDKVRLKSSETPMDVEYVETGEDGGLLCEFVTCIWLDRDKKLQKYDFNAECLEKINN